MSESQAERWRAIPGYEGKYEVSDKGRVRSLPRTVPRRRNPVPGRIMKQGRNLKGRFNVALSDDGVSTMRSVHRLVLEAFVGPCPPDMVCCHNNGNHEDNRLENLRWDTRSENSYDTVRHGNNRNAQKTHCKHGHEFNAENTDFRPSGHRWCRPCRKAASDAFHLRAAAKKASA